MLVLRDPELSSSIEDDDLRLLVEQRFIDMGGDDEYDPNPRDLALRHRQGL